MPTGLKRVDPNRPPSLFSRAYAALANTPFGSFLSVHVVWKLDPHLMRLTRGRLGMGLVMPTALLETQGAKSGEPRRNVVIYFHDGERVTLVASNAGAPRHPAWYHNLLANPDAEVEVGSEKFRVHATPRPSGPERDRLFAQQATIMPGFWEYEKKTTRVIPAVILERVEEAAAA